MISRCVAVVVIMTGAWACEPKTPPEQPTPYAVSRDPRRKSRRCRQRCVGLLRTQNQPAGKRAFLRRNTAVATFATEATEAENLFPPANLQTSENSGSTPAASTLAPISFASRNIREPSQLKSVNSKVLARGARFHNALAGHPK